jgi:hypothetical protein
MLGTCVRTLACCEGGKCHAKCWQGSTPQFQLLTLPCISFTAGTANHNQKKTCPATRPISKILKNGFGVRRFMLVRKWGRNANHSLWTVCLGAWTDHAPEGAKLRAGRLWIQGSMTGRGRNFLVRTCKPSLGVRQTAHLQTVLTFRM